MKNYIDPWIVKAHEIWGISIPSREMFQKILGEIESIEDRKKLIAHNNKIIETFDEKFHPSRSLNNCENPNKRKILELYLKAIKIMGRQAEILGLNHSILHMQNRAIATWYLLVIGNYSGSGMQKIRKMKAPDELDLDGLANHPKLDRYPEYLLAQDFLFNHRRKVNDISEINSDMKALEVKKNKLLRRLAYCLEKGEERTYLFHCEYCGRLSNSKKGIRKIRCGSSECEIKHSTIYKKTIRESNKKFNSNHIITADLEKAFEGKRKSCRECGKKRVLYVPYSCCKTCSIENHSR